MVEKLAKWRKEDPQGVAVLLGGFIFAWFFTLGIPLWDDDFTSWSRKVDGQSIFRFLWEWISPISTQPEHWGFNERPVQSLIYKTFQMVSGYEAWSYFLFKSAIYAAVGWRIYRLGLLLGGETSRLARFASAGVAALYLLSPGPVAALILHQDVAPVAALVNLLLLEWIFRSVEATPVEWRGLPDFSKPAVRSWAAKWLGIAVCIYLGYKTKADVKLLGPVLAAYILVTRRHQWAYFAIPIGAAALLAVPWGPGIFTRLPPFVPGSGGSSVGWMFQEAKLARVFSYLWSPDAFPWRDFYLSAPLSLAGILGPFVLIVAAGFAIWRVQGDDRPLARWNKTAHGRAWVLFAIWWAVVMGATSALSDINFTFRLRYGILTLTPTAILLAGLAVAYIRSAKELPRYALHVACAALVLQAGMNLLRSAKYRRDMGIVMVSVDQAYERVAKDFPGASLALMPDFRPYDYRPGAGRVFDLKTVLADTGDLSKKAFPPGNTIVISWNPTLWEEIELIEAYTGCRSYSPFDWLWPCPKKAGAMVMRWLGANPLYQKAELLRKGGKNAEALALHEQFLKDHPGSLAVRFVIGLESFLVGNPTRAWEVFHPLSEYFPNNNAVLFNTALAGMETQHLIEAAKLLETIAEREPTNYGVLYNLQEAYKRSRRDRARERVVRELERLFPQDDAVKKLRAS